MKKRRLHNYVYSARLKSGLSQDDVAFLMGCKSGSKLSRCERQRRTCTLKAALGFEIIFGVQLRDLFAGFGDDIESAIVKRAGRLGQMIMSKPPTKKRTQKLKALAVIVHNCQ